MKFSIIWLLGWDIRVSNVLFFFLVPVIVIIFHVAVLFRFLLLVVVGSSLETDVTFFQGA